MTLRHSTSGPTVIVGLSGGVDSSVTAMLLSEAGYRVIGVFLHFWSDPTSAKASAGKSLANGGATKNNKCCSIETMLQARKVADKLGIAFYSLDLSEVFKEKVVDYFLSAYSQGWTPNPCIMCNRDIKFGAVLDAFETFGADYWATGHYAKIAVSGERLTAGNDADKRLSSSCQEEVASFAPKRNETEESKEIYHLFQPRDLDKDQTYFLHALTQDKLARTLFPLGDYLKSEVRELATRLQVEHYGGTYRESQNLCFYAESEPDAFLERNLPPEIQQPGEIKTREGKVLGTHRGLFHYTVGQRRGIEIPADRAYYVVGVDLPSNALIVGAKEDLLSTECKLSNVTFTRPISPDELIDLDVKVRYSKTSARGDIVISRQSVVDREKAKNNKHKDGSAPLSPQANKGGRGDFANNLERATIDFHEPVRAATPGQHAVFYRGGECLGGGVIIGK